MAVKMKVVWVGGRKYIDNGVFLDARKKTLEAFGGWTENRTDDIGQKRGGHIRKATKNIEAIKKEKLKKAAEGTKPLDGHMEN